MRELGLGRRVTITYLDRADVLVRVLGQQLGEPADGRVVDLHVPELELAGRGARLDVGQAVDFRQRIRERLLDEHREAGLEGPRRFPCESDVRRRSRRGRRASAGRPRWRTMVVG